MNTPPYVATKDEYLKTWYRYASEKNMAEILEEIELKKIILNKQIVIIIYIYNMTCLPNNKSSLVIQTMLEIMPH